jgi:hypothetical protein
MSTTVVGIRTFRVPRTLIDNRGLKNLSGDALRLFLAVSYRCYRTRSPEARFSFKELLRETDMLAKEAQAAVKELRKEKLVHFQQDKNILIIQIQDVDGSKAKHYLRPPSETVIKQD